MLFEIGYHPKTKWDAHPSAGGGSIEAMFLTNVEVACLS